MSFISCAVLVFFGGASGEDHKARRNLSLRLGANSTLDSFDVHFDCVYNYVLCIETGLCGVHGWTSQTSELLGDVGAHQHATRSNWQVDILCNFISVHQVL